MVNLLHIGLGAWGPGLARNLAKTEGARLVSLCDGQDSALKKASTQFPGVQLSKNYQEFLSDGQIDAVSIATPANTHFRLAKEFLEKGKHVLVEKPLAMTVEESGQLVKIAHDRKLVLMVGHVFLFNPAVRKLKEYYRNGEFGDVYYMYSQRLNLGRVRQDVDALWNFAPHDISIMTYLLDCPVEAVSARGLTILQPGIADVVFLQLMFQGGITGHIQVSWIDPNKVRRMTIVGSKKMVVYDDVDPDRKIQIFDKGIDRKSLNSTFGQFDNFGTFQYLVRAGDIFIPKIDSAEPLYLECKHFVECIQNKQSPLTDGRHGLAITQILEAASLSMRQDGAVVSIQCRD